MEDMLLFIKKYPEMILDARETAKTAKLPHYEAGKEYDKILVCGMGGSAIGGDLLKSLLHDFPEIPIESVEVSRQYKMPKVGENTLIFCISYSGNTEETLSQFVDARKAGCKIIAFTSDGLLKNWCERLGVPLIELPSGFKPRAALPYLFIPMVQYVAGDAFDQDFEECIKVLEDMRGDAKEMQSIKDAASLIKDHWIAVYGSSELEPVVFRAKTQINENSKLPAVWGVFPEMCHNEIVGYEDNDLNRNLYVVILRDEESEKNDSMLARIESTKEIIRQKVKGIIEIHSAGKSKLARMMSLLYYVDMLSYYLARESGKSPDKNDNIDKLKDALKDKVNLQEKLEKELV
jgi:glucose/mannose-6-phosphate isomerase